MSDRELEKVSNDMLYKQIKTMSMGFIFQAGYPQNNYSRNQQYEGR